MEREGRGVRRTDLVEREGQGIRGTDPETRMIRERERAMRTLKGILRMGEEAVGVPQPGRQLEDGHRAWVSA